MFLGYGELGIELDEGRDGLKYDHNHLKEIDPVSANRIHPNNHRKVRLPILCTYEYENKWLRTRVFHFECLLFCVIQVISLVSD